MAISVSKRVSKKIGVESAQSVAGGEASAVNCSLDETFGNFTLAARATAPAIAVGGGAAAWWWSEYVKAELGRQAARRERLARYGELVAIAPMPWAEAEIEAQEPATGDLLAVMRLPQVSAEIFAARLLTVVDHTETVDDEALALLGAALLLAA